jgi:alpha-amylase/alpha-mannosidase (GH57 family)
MHQPFYKDLWTGEYKLPWTRLHAMKDYAGMVEILKDFPTVRQTFNLVPSMIAQIEEYATGAASDPFLDVASIPAEDLTESQRNFMLRYLFQANVEKMIYRYPRFRELYENREQPSTQHSVQDLRDLQVLSQIIWFDEDVLARDAELQELIEKGRSFSLDDQTLVLRKERELLARVLPVYREFCSTGQIEISTTPFYHPILPLICDTDIAAVSHPGILLPRRFRYPQDARDQLCLAKSYIRQKLGTDPAGLWPSEGSVSDEALGLAAECGFQWAASDNGVLSRTLNRDAGPDLTYQAYQWQQHGRSIKLLFRDHFLSDLIGFSYQRVPAAEAAEHFLAQIRNNARGRDMLVPIILDGENAWEWYEANGRPFLRELYHRIAESPDLQAVTVSEALSRFEANSLAGIFPGSWINANFDIWIGAEEDNLAWDLLLDARRAYDEARDLPEDMRKLAYEELLIAEGSDWNWWYGPEHRSDNRPEFDQLYRDHLSNVYRALGQKPPDALAVPILQSQAGEYHEPPSNPIHATVDGEVTSYFEWLGAGRYRPDLRSGAMHSSAGPVHEFLYGTDGEYLYVRLDRDGESTLGIEFENGPVETQTAVGRVVELRAPLSGKRFRLTVARAGLPPTTIPPQGWIEL